MSDVVIKEEAQPKILDKCVLIIVETSRLGNRKKVPSAKVEVDAEREAISVSKELLESKELKDITSLDSTIRRYIYERCLPSFFKTGVYLLPVTTIDECEAKLKMFKAEREELIANFLGVYEQQKKIARGRLRSCFDESDYPPIEIVKQSFAMRWEYVQFGIPENLNKVNPALFQEQKKQAEARWREAENSVMLLLRANATDLVSHLVDKLTPDSQGKKKKFHASALENLRGFIETFKSRNVTDDAELDQIIEQCRALTEGLDADVLRSDEDVRENFQAAFSGIKSQLDTMMVEDKKKNRMFRFDDED